MASVVQRIREVKQPRGGYIHPKTFSQKQFSDGFALSQNESIHPVNVGLTVDYLFRATLPWVGASKAFGVSLAGANYGRFSVQSQKLVSQITSIDDDQSIIAAAKLTGYDVISRTGYIPDLDPSYSINADQDTIQNIRKMIERTQTFFDTFEPITVDEFSFGYSSPNGGYTNTITAGDGDYLTADGLWDLKVSVKSPSSAHTLQVIVYWLMGLNSFNADGAPLYDGNFQNINHLGLFNPRLNIAYTLNVEDIPKETIREVETQVIGYP